MPSSATLSGLAGGLLSDQGFASGLGIASNDLTAHASSTSKPGPTGLMVHNWKEEAVEGPRFGRLLWTCDCAIPHLLPRLEQTSETGMHCAVFIEGRLSSGPEWRNVHIVHLQAEAELADEFAQQPRVPIGIAWWLVGHGVASFDPQ